MNRITLKENPEYGQVLGKGFDFEIKDLKDTLFEALRTLEIEVQGCTPCGLRLYQNWDNPKKMRLEVYVRDERRFLT